MTSGSGNYDLATKLPEARAIRRGDMVWIDAGCAVCGYWSDFSRAAVVGQPSAEQFRAQKIYQITWEAIRKVRPGVCASQLAQACNPGSLGWTLPSPPRYPDWLGVGHGVGLDVTEPPHIAESDSTILQPGMVITLEPGVATEYGTFNVEENVLVTPEGCEVLSKAPRALWWVATREESMRRSPGAGKLRMESEQDHATRISADSGKTEASFP